MHKRIKNLLILTLVAVLLLSTGCSNASTSGGQDVISNVTFSYWIPRGEEEYYPDYADNPSINYITNYKTFEYENGQFTIDFEFITPVTGSERDNFNTLLATGDYADVMDMSFFNGSVVELYEEGVILDLTEYVEKYMPNYRAWLDANPDYARTSTNIVNGETKYLQLYNYRDDLLAEYWGGYVYRRDWIVKYGKNPTDGSAFSGEFTEMNPDGTPNQESWTDNVIFPSGGVHPIYISDWEWMFEIFTVAMEDLGITDGYSMSLYYPGYLEQGDLVSAFGGGGSHWYLDKSGEFKFGATEDDFRIYLQAMNTWYNNGWIDKAFTEHSTDMFFMIDSAKVRQGKVGLWYGMQSAFMNSLDTGEDYTDGIITFAARQPMNDIYGGQKQQNVEPYTFFAPVSKEGSPICITSQAAEKDLAALFTWMDYMYSEEGTFLKFVGLSKEQYEECKDPFYTKLGLTEGAYYMVDTEEGPMWEYVEQIQNDSGSLRSSSSCLMAFGGSPDNWIAYRNQPVSGAMVNEWAAYTCTAHLPNSFVSQMSPEDTKTFTKIQTQIREFMVRNVPLFITGEKDPFSDDGWNAFVNALKKYSPDTNTKIYQNLYMRFE